MKNEINKWEKLVNMPDEYKRDLELADKAIERIESNKPKTRKIRKSLWLSVAASLIVCVIGLAVFLPIYFSSNDEPDRLYYSSENITSLSVADLEEYFAENNINVYYYKTEIVDNYACYITEENELAYIMQDVVFFNEDTLDIINLKIVVLDNVDFYFYNEFNFLKDAIIIGEIVINYYIIEGQQIHAKFETDNATYFITIDTNDYNVETLEKYTSLLIK